MSSQYGCGRNVALTNAFGEPRANVACGTYHLGELIQCDDCQESKPPPPELLADPGDEDAQGELEAEREFTRRGSSSDHGVKP